MNILRNFWKYMSIFLFYYEIGNSSHINQKSPTKINFKFQFSKFNEDPNNETIQFNICIDKNREKCFWALNKKLVFNDDMTKEFSYSFFVNEMDTNLTISIIMKNNEQIIHFSKKIINVKKIDTKDTFELHSVSLEHFIKLTVEYDCELNYYPKKQCTKFCYPVPNEYLCDDFGRKICKEGLSYDAKEEKCLPNNCIKSVQCMNNGFCINKGSTFECSCMDGYIGKFCEYPNPCFPNPCYNEGKCSFTSSYNSYNCTCSSGFVGKHCEKRHEQPCNCPSNMKCNYSESGVLFSCTTVMSDGITKKGKIDTTNNDYVEKNQNNDRLIRNLDSKKEQSWAFVSLTTTVVVAIGCLVIIISIIVSICVFFRTRNYSSNYKNSIPKSAPSTQYTQFTPKFGEGTFQRSLSLDDNSAYLPVNSNILSNTPVLLRLGSCNGLSVSSNSYQEHPMVVNCSLYNDPCKQDLLPAYMMINRNCTEMSNTDTLSSGSIPPPELPPRPDIGGGSPVLHTNSDQI